MSDAAAARSVETRASWIVALAAVAILSVSFGAPLIVVVALKGIAADLGAPRALPALASSLAWLGAGAGGIFMGFVAGRAGQRRVAAFGAAMVAAGLALAATGKAWALLAGFGLLVGLLGNGALFPPMMAYVSLWFDRRRGTALALVSSGQYVAGALWPPLLEGAVERVGWQATMLGFATIVLATVLPLALLLRPPPALPASGGAVAEPGPGGRVLGLPPGLALGLLGLAVFLCCIPMAMPAGHLVAFCSDLGIAPARGALMLSVLLGAAFLARQFWGWVADRIGGLATVLLGNLAQIAGMAAFLTTQDEAGLFAVSAAYGLGFSGIIPAYVLAVRELFPAAEAHWRVPVVLCLGLMGMATGGWLAGALYDAYGSYAVAWQVGVAVNAAQLALIGLLVLRRGRQLQAVVA
ncbi:MAG TPA: MFS transporter [Crenalkalicoccus sp.]|nr:MFS transporter [Crenalkalicoccus sp.]